MSVSIKNMEQLSSSTSNCKYIFSEAMIIALNGGRIDLSRFTQLCSWFKMFFLENHVEKFVHGKISAYSNKS